MIISAIKGSNAKVKVVLGGLVWQYTVHRGADKDAGEEISVLLMSNGSEYPYSGRALVIINNDLPTISIEGPGSEKLVYSEGLVASTVDYSYTVGDRLFELSMHTEGWNIDVQCKNGNDYVISAYAKGDCQKVEDESCPPAISVMDLVEFGE